MQCEIIQNIQLKGSNGQLHYHIFGIVWTWAFTWWYPGYVFLYQNLKQFGKKQKNSCFLHFLVSLSKKIQVAANRTLSKIDALPIAHFEENVPNFSKHMLKLAIPSKIWVSDPPKVSWSEFLSLRKAVFRPLFLGKSLFWPISTQFTPPHDIHRWKAMDLSFHVV